MKPASLFDEDYDPLFVEKKGLEVLSRDLCPEHKRGLQLFILADIG